jgi:hypothetical protein
VCRSARFGDEDCQVLDLPLHGVRLRVAAVVATSAGEVVGGEILCQFFSERGVLRTVIEPTTDQDHRRPVTVALIRDRGAVGRRHVCH